jgi:putative ubiquitin-RnfH superfamily antitoxin RatB of RatAB toxin-antitoxin module
VSLRPFICLMFLGWSTGPVLAHWLDSCPPIVICTAQDIRKLAPEEAKSGRTVKLSGVITHINPHLNDFFLQDNSAGIYVQPTDLAKGLSLGDRVELEGVTDPGDFAPCIHANKITQLGQGKLPDAFAYTLVTEESRWLDAQWVQVSVVVRGVRTGPDVTR